MENACAKCFGHLHEELVAVLVLWLMFSPFSDYLMYLEDETDESRIYDLGLIKHHASCS